MGPPARSEEVGAYVSSRLGSRRRTAAIFQLEPALAIALDTTLLTLNGHGAFEMRGLVVGALFVMPHGKFNAILSMIILAFLGKSVQEFRGEVKTSLDDGASHCRNE